MAAAVSLEVWNRSIFLASYLSISEGSEFSTLEAQYAGHHASWVLSTMSFVFPCFEMSRPFETKDIEQNPCTNQIQEGAWFKGGRGFNHGLARAWCIGPIPKIWQLWALWNLRYWAKPMDQSESRGGVVSTLGYICSLWGQAYVCKVSWLQLKQGLRWARSKFSIGRYSATYGGIGFKRNSVLPCPPLHASTKFRANRRFPSRVMLMTRKQTNKQTDRRTKWSHNPRP